MKEKRVPCKECDKLISKYQAKKNAGFCIICAAAKRRKYNERDFSKYKQPESLNFLKHK